ncbi:hypothetical protein [Sinomonas puerhi]
MPFTHLHVSPSSGTPSSGPGPEELAEAALADGATALARTHRDGLYGAVEHVGTCLERGLAPIVGVDLAVLAEPEEPEGGPLDEGQDSAAADGAEHGSIEAREIGGKAGGRRPSRGSAGVAGRVVVLAHGANGGAGWRALCRLVSDAHAHTRGRNAASSGGRVPAGVLRSELAARCLDPESGRPVLTVLVGPDSDVGLAMGGPKFLRPRTLFREWARAMPAGVLAVELVTHLSPPGEPLSTSRAVRMLRLASEHGVPAVLSNAVQCVEEAGEAWFKPADAMREIGAALIGAAGLRGADLENLLSNTERIADRCRLDPASDVGWTAGPDPSGPDPSGPDSVAAVADLLRTAGLRSAERGTGARGLAAGAAPGLDVETTQLRTVYRTIARHFGADRVVLVRAQGRGRDGDLSHDRPEDAASDEGGRQPELLGRPPEVPSPRPADAASFGVVIGDASLLDRVPAEPSGMGVPVSQFGREEIERLGLLTIEIRGERRLSVVAHAALEAARVEGSVIDLDAAEPADGSTVLDAQCAWLRAYHPAAYLAGIAEHDGGTDPGRLLSAEARRLGVPVLPLDVNESRKSYQVERIASGPDAGKLGVRPALTGTGGLSRRELERLVAHQPYASVSDVRVRAQLRDGPTRRLAELGAFDSLYRAAADLESRADLVAQLARLAEPARPAPHGAPGEGQLRLELEGAGQGMGARGR